MISGGVEVHQFGQIRLIIEAKFGLDTSEHDAKKFYTIYKNQNVKWISGNVIINKSFTKYKSKSLKNKPMIICDHAKFAFTHLQCRTNRYSRDTKYKVMSVMRLFR